MRLTPVVCALTGAALLLVGCEQSMLRVEEPPSSGLRVETQNLPVPKSTVVPPEAKTAICPDCAERLAPVKTVAPVVAAPVLEDIHFDYDKHDIRPGDAEILRRDLAWFGANPGRRVRVEGYCDERGTGKYNVSLGERRAVAARDYLIGLGVDGALLDVVTYGKDRPGTPGHNREVWVSNRRVHFAPY